MNLMSTQVMPETLHWVKSVIRHKWLQFFRYLPREVDPLVYNMSHEDPGNISYSEVGGLSEQIRELREVCVVHCVQKSLC